MSIKDVHHCDPNNDGANLVRLHHVQKTSHGSEWSYSSHTCFEKIGRANSIQFMDCSTAIAGCSESSQIPTHPREETKRIKTRWDIGSTTRKFSKAPLYRTNVNIRGLQWCTHQGTNQCSITTKFYLSETLNTSLSLSCILITILSFVRRYL